MRRVLNISGFCIYQGLEHSREPAWLELSRVLNIPEYARILPEYT